MTEYHHWINCQVIQSLRLWICSHVKTILWKLSFFQTSVNQRKLTYFTPNVLSRRMTYIVPLASYLNHHILLQAWHLRLFSHKSKVRNLNDHSNCAIWMIIRMMAFWTVCTQNYIAMRNLKCATQMTVRRCFPVMYLSNHAVKSLYECLDLKIVSWGGGGGGATWPSNHFHLYTAHWIMYRRTGNASSMYVLLAGYPDTNEAFLLLWNAKPQFWSLVCILRSSNVAITSLACTLRNSNYALCSCVKTV